MEEDRLAREENRKLREEHEKSEKKKVKPKKKNRLSNTLLTVAIVICLGVMAYSGYRLISTYLAYRQGTEEYDSLRQYTVAQQAEGENDEISGEDADSEDTGSKPGSNVSFYTSVTAPIDVDWESLKAINEDIVGWLYIETLDISYPIVQGSDNDFYLHHTFEKTDNFAGSIFVEYQNSGDFSDPNTIVYGHNMKNGSMFGMLAHLQTDELYKGNPWFWILTPDGNYRYRIFSMRQTEVAGETYTLFTGTDQTFLDWCEDMYGQSNAVLEEPVFSLDSRIVTLSTCTGDDSYRFVVQGIAVR